MAPPAIGHGPGFTDRVQLGQYPDELAAYLSPAEGYERGTSEGTGRLHTRIRPLESFIGFTARHIPLQGTADETGWRDAGGWRVMMGRLRAGEAVRYWPDASAPSRYHDCYLHEPKEGPPDIEIGGGRRQRLVLRTADGSRVGEI